MAGMQAATRIAVIGGGPAGMMAAETIARALGPRVRVTIVERMPSPGRKFLMAGRGGLNLTHSEDLETFLGRYAGDGGRLAGILRAFPPQALRAWCEGLGQETFVGSSGRVFPRAFKASPLLRAWLKRLDDLGVAWRLRTRWLGFDGPGRILLSGDGPAGESGPAGLPVDAVVLAAGGASWPRLGSDGGWVAPLAAAGVAVVPLRPANAGFRVLWSALFRERFAGTPLKAMRFRAGAAQASGEAMVTQAGLEGGAIYALSAALRDEWEARGTARLLIDLKPDVSEGVVRDRLSRSRPGETVTSLLRRGLSLAPVAIGLLREAAGKDLPRDPAALAGLVKHLSLALEGPMGLERAISTAGGVAWDEVDAHLMLRRRPGVFVAGEMLDWEAPTGGYLLQACFASGVAAGEGVVTFLKARPAGRGASPAACRPGELL